ncbi:MAG: hypothetical protein ACFFFG_11985 [Candidatus Thorarchaeota archaeon]
MSIIHLESGTQTSTAAKAFCSICLSIALLLQPLSSLLQNIQILLFWSGTIFIILSILPLLEGLCINLPIWLFYDRHLPKGAFLLRTTLSQPYWERFLNETIRDIYLISAFVIVILRNNAVPLFDPVLISFYDELNTYIGWICGLLVGFLLIRMSYRYFQNFYDIKLIQHYLTVVTTSGDTIEELNTLYLNKAIPLFRQRFLVEFKRVKSDIISRVQQITTFLSYKQIDSTSYFGSFQKDMMAAHQALSGIRLSYHFSFRDMEALTLLEAIVSTLEIITNVFRYLFTEQPPEGVPYLLFSQNTVHQKVHWEQYNYWIEKALNRANYDPSILSNESVIRFYENLSKFLVGLGTMEKRLDLFILQGEKDRGYVSFLKTLVRIENE